jgi:hypothetical protein
VTVTASTVASANPGNSAGPMNAFSRVNAFGVSDPLTVGPHGLGHTESSKFAADSAAGLTSSPGFSSVQLMPGGTSMQLLAAPDYLALRTSAPTLLVLQSTNVASSQSPVGSALAQDRFFERDFIGNGFGAFLDDHAFLEAPNDRSIPPGAMLPSFDTNDADELAPLPGDAHGANQIAPSASGEGSAQHSWSDGELIDSFFSRSGDNAVLGAVAAGVLVSGIYQQNRDGFAPGGAPIQRSRRNSRIR